MAALVITPEIEAAAQRLAEATGTTATEAVAEALRKQVALTPLPKPLETAEERKARWERIDALLKQIHSMPIDYSQSEDEILGYDAFGVPEQPYLGR